MRAIQSAVPRTEPSLTRSRPCLRHPLYALSVCLFVLVVCFDIWVCPLRLQALRQGKKRGVPSTRYDAPELHAAREVHEFEMCDVWSLGILLWELFTQTTAPCQLVDPQGQVSLAFMPMQLRSLIVRCLSHDPEARPAAREVRTLHDSCMASLYRLTPAAYLTVLLLALPSNHHGPSPFRALPNATLFQSRNLDRVKAFVAKQFGIPCFPGWRLLASLRR